MVNVSPVLPAARTIRPEDTLILNARRAGNRGRNKKAAAEPLVPRPL